MLSCYYYKFIEREMIYERSKYDVSRQEFDDIKNTVKDLQKVYEYMKKSIL